MTCQLVARRDAGEAPLWDNIYRGAHWDVVHSFNTALPGWLVLVTRRHVAAIDELTAEEATELGALLRSVSLALKTVTGCSKTYVLQFAEHLLHPHVHFHIVPRMPDMPADRRGARVMAYLSVLDDERVGEADMNALALQLRALLP